jgi:tetratricopeptide (TPR) repeat protein
MGTVLFLSILALTTPDTTRAAESYDKACSPALMSGSTLAGSALAEIAACHHHLATLANDRGDTAQSEMHYLRALTAWEQTGETRLQPWSTSLMNLGQLYRQQRRAPEAERRFLEAIAIARRIEAQFPEAYPEALSRLGGLYGESDQPERGRRLLTEAIAKLGKLPGETAELASAHNSLGMIDLAARHLTAGEANLRKAVELAASSLGEDALETTTWRINLALALVLEGQYGRAEPMLRRARFVVETRAATGSAKPDTRLAAIFAEFSAAAADENKLALAEDYAQQELAVLTRQPVPDETAIALAQVNLGSVYLRERRIDDAERILPAAVAAERQLATRGRILADGILRLAELRAFQQSWSEADALYREAIGLYEDRLGPNHPAIAPVLRAYAGALKRGGGSKAEARSLEARAKAILNSAPHA